MKSAYPPLQDNAAGKLLYSIRRLSYECACRAPKGADRRLANSDSGPSEADEATSRVALMWATMTLFEVRVRRLVFMLVRRYLAVYLVT